MQKKVYLLDANVFIQAANTYYAFDIAPSFWNNLIRYAEKGQIITISRVKQEIALGKDDLSKWLAEEFSAWTISSDDELVVLEYANVMKWIYSQEQYYDSAKNDFASGADGWLIAYAMASGCYLVTQETYRPGIKRKIPIPNVCNAFDINCLSTFQLLRELKIRL